MPQLTDSKLVKMSVNMRKETIELLKQMAKKRGTTVTSTILAAINTLKFVYDVEDKGGVVLTKDKRGKMQQLIFLRGA